MQELKKELLERYKATGRVGLVKPMSEAEAHSMIDTIIEIYEQDPEENVFTLKEIADRLSAFLDSF